MKIKGFLFTLFALVFGCSAFSQDSTKTTMHHKTATHHKMTPHKHHMTSKSSSGTMTKSKKMSGTDMSDSTK